MHLLVFHASKGHYISGVCVKILEIPKWKGAGYILGADFGKSRGEGGHAANPFPGGGLFFFSGTTHYKLNLFQKKLEGGFISVYFFCLLVDHGLITGRG